MRYVALFRAINVTGYNIVRMEQLRGLFAELGFGGVNSYIQSGNVAFDSDAGEESCRQLIAEAFAKEFFPTEVMIRSSVSILATIDANPFAAHTVDDKQLHVAFLAEPITEEKSAILHSLNTEREIYEARGREVYCLLRDGVARSLLAKKFIDNKLKIPATARNWRTVRTIATL